MLNQPSSRTALSEAGSLLDDNLPIVDAALGSLQIDRFRNVERWYEEMSARDTMKKARTILSGT